MTFALNSLLIFYQLINNLLSRASRPGPRIGRRWKDLKHIRGRGFSPTPFLSFDLRLQAWCLWWWQKRSKYQPLFFLNFQKWCYKSSLYTAANQKIKAYWHTFQFYKPIYCSCDQASDADDLFWFHQDAWFSAKPHGRFRWHIWIQYWPCITILAFLIYVHSMFHLHPRGGGCTFLKTSLEFFISLLYPWKFQTKQCSTPGYSTKLCHIPWKFQGQK